MIMMVTMMATMAVVVIEDDHSLENGSDCTAAAAAAVPRVRNDCAGTTDKVEEQDGGGEDGKAKDDDEEAEAEVEVEADPMPSLLSYSYFSSVRPPEVCSIGQAYSVVAAQVLRVLRATVVVLGGCALGSLPSDRDLWVAVRPMLLDGSLRHRVRHFDR